MELLPEEVYVLLSKGIARLCEFKDLNDSLKPAIIEERNNMYKESFTRQSELFKEERKSQLLKMSGKIIEGKRKKYCKGPEPFDEAKALQEEIDKIPEMSEDLMMIQIFTSKYCCLWQQLLMVVYGSIAFVGPHWNCLETQKGLPTSQAREKIKCLVFIDLWEKGYHMTSGEKFGGDFLVYPGDPIRFHSHYIAVCVDCDEELSPYYIVSKGRLGTNVKKTVLLCTVTKSGEISYQSLNWCGK